MVFTRKQVQRGHFSLQIYFVCICGSVEIIRREFFCVYNYVCVYV